MILCAAALHVASTAVLAGKSARLVLLFRAGGPCDGPPVLFTNTGHQFSGRPVPRLG